MTGPMARASPAMAAHSPRARSRACAIGIELAEDGQRPRLAGGRSDAHDGPGGDERPVLGASAPKSEPAMKTTTPTSMTRLRPSGRPGCRRPA